MTEIIEIKGAPVLHLSDEADGSGDIINSECEIEIPAEAVPVTQRYDASLTVGMVMLRRDGCQILGDFIFAIESAETLIAASKYVGIVPCMAGQIVERDGNIIKKMKLTSIGLFPGGKNVDSKIPNLNFGDQ